MVEKSACYIYRIFQDARREQKLKYKLLIRNKKMYIAK